MNSPKKVTKQITVFCGVVIKDGKVLMTLRTEPECPKAHLKWEFPGGKVDFGEGPKDAIERELLEEAGVVVKVKDFLPFIQVSNWVYSSGNKTQVFGFAYLCELIKSVDLEKMDHHVKEIAWQKIEDVKKIDSLPGTNELLKVALKNLGS